MRRTHIVVLVLGLMSASIPDTIPHPPINQSNGFRIGVTNLDTNTLLWSAPYLYETPYVPDSGWLPGDRVGYGCAYTFIQFEGRIIGRATFRAIPEAASYMRINDTYMDEGQRYYDGSSTPPGTQQVPPLECPAVAESYETSQVPDERPVVVFWQGDTAVEIRDYRETQAAPGVTFDLFAEITSPFTVTSSTSGTHTVTNRITVLAREAGVPEAVVYYDALGAGSMFPPAASTFGCTALVGMSQISQLYTGTAFPPPGGIPTVGDSPLETLTGDQWMLIFKGGKALYWWTLAPNWNTTVVDDRCADDTAIDRMIFGFDPAPGSPQQMVSRLNQVISIIHSRYPAVTSIGLLMLVGSEGHVTCTMGGQTVQAAGTHAGYIDDLQAASWPADVHVGPDIEVPCAGYSDSKGHLTGTGAQEAQQELAAFYPG